ncbi:MAG TPA: 2'-5' RNA ligase family protein [Acidimicrobiales bacterium]|nr:2'-5' RNA ligase family protein [Acidimicrobiales bacterium]
MSRQLGVVIMVPQPIATEVDGLRRALGDGALARIAPHVTLVAPVGVPGDRMPDAVDVLRDAAKATPPLDLRIGPATTFHPVTPVVYLSVTGDLATLVALRERVLRPPLVRPASHPFVPHVTVADELDGARIPAAVAALADFVVDVRIESLHLLEQGRDRVWRPVAEAPFTRRWLPPAGEGEG